MKTKMKKDLKKRKKSKVEKILGDGRPLLLEDLGRLRPLENEDERTLRS